MNFLTLKNVTMASIVLIFIGFLPNYYPLAEYTGVFHTAFEIGIVCFILAFFLYAVKSWGTYHKIAGLLMVAIPISIYNIATTKIPESTTNILVYLAILFCICAIFSVIVLFVSEKVKNGIDSIFKKDQHSRYFHPDLTYAFLGLIIVSIIAINFGSSTILNDNMNLIAGSIQKNSQIITSSNNQLFTPTTTYANVQTNPAIEANFIEDLKNKNSNSGSARFSALTTPPTPLITTFPVDTMNYEIGLTYRSFSYVLRGKTGTINLDLYSGVNSEISSTPRIYCLRYNYDTSPCILEEKRQYYLEFLNDPVQKKYLADLVQAIKLKTSDKDDQARIAISLVQQIPYDYNKLYKFSSPATASGDKMRAPYQVLYDNTGVCGEKSLVLAYLLRELGYGVVLFEFNTDNHMAVGVRSPAPYAYINSGYAFVETAAPSIPTDSSGDYVGVGKLKSIPVILSVSDGRSFDSIAEEYNDAQSYNILLAMGQVLDETSYYQWLMLVQKYGMMKGISSSQNQLTQSYSATCNINLGRYCSAGLNCCEKDNLCYLPCSQGTWVPNECVCVG